MDICPDCQQRVGIGEWPMPCGGRGHALGSFWRGDAQIHTSEKVTIYRNEHTGDIKIPGRGDRPIHPKLAAAGYHRETLDTPAQVREVERKTGTMHEAGNYDSPHSSQALKDTGSI